MNQAKNVNDIRICDEEILLPDTVSLDANAIPNAVLQRLIEEVKYESQNNISAYNRTHNRHNRGR